MNQKNYNSNWKNILGFRNMQEKLEKYNARALIQEYADEYDNTDYTP